MEENKKLVQFIFNENKDVVFEKSADNIKRLIRSYDLWASECEPEKTWYHYASDEQGSTIFITDEEKVCNRYDYDAWGNLTTCEEIIPNRILYTGQQFDQITQQYYLRARYYNPVIARFTQEDVYRGDGLNLYTYCDNNPVIYYDPSGYACNPKLKNIYEKQQQRLPSRKEAFREAKRDLGIPITQQPYEIKKTDMKEPEYAGGHAIKDKNGKVIKTREYYFRKYNPKEDKYETYVIQDHSAGHEKGNQGPHFNVRPIENRRNGDVIGTKQHYPFKK